MAKSIIIKPITDLRYKITEIENICIDKGQPVFITKNGKNHLVVMSQEYFDKKVGVSIDPAAIEPCSFNPRKDNSGKVLTKES